MRGYLSYFKLQLMVGLQYKTAAIAGLLTQYAWGFMYACIYTSFYSYASINDFNISALMSYVWLNQAFFSLTYMNIKVPEITESIRNGGVAYELIRPYNLYSWWYVKLLATRYARVALRCIPVLVLAFLLPGNFGLSLPQSYITLLLSIITLVLGTFLTTGLNMLVNTLTFFTMQDKGLAGIIYNIGNLFGGFMLPIPLLPVVIIKTAEYLPFRLIGDLPYRIYSGSMEYLYILKSIVLQIIWIIVLYFSGKLLMKFALKRVSIQGG